MRREELLARIRVDRAAFAAKWDGLSDEQMVQRPGVQDDWSVKDLIAHLTWWETLMLENVMAVKNGSTEYHMIYDIDRQNAEVFEKYQDTPLPDVLLAFGLNLALLEEHIGALTEDQINNTQLPKYPLLEHIIGDTFGHYETHRPDLERYVSEVRASAAQ
jgi:hypothetical protein